jgi:starch phosphorylase
LGWAGGNCLMRLGSNQKCAISTKDTLLSPCWNEHAAFMKATGSPFAVALAATRAGNLFTTHTAVASGFDIFSPALMEQYFGRYAKEALGLSMRELLALGRKDPTDADEPFNMAYLAIRGSGAVNGVSRLHGQVSRHIFAPLFPRRPEGEVPIGYVTNGVHMPTWDSKAADKLWTEACGKSDGWARRPPSRRICARSLTRDCGRCATRTGSLLVEYAREGIGRQMAAVGCGASGDRPDAGPAGSAQS